MSRLDDVINQLESCRDDRDTAHDYLLWHKEERDTIDEAITLLQAGARLVDAAQGLRKIPTTSQYDKVTDKFFRELDGLEELLGGGLNE